jgi:hypothetical protein
MLSVLRGALPLAATVAAAPVLVAGAIAVAAGAAAVAVAAATAAAAAALLDPIVLGAWTLDREAEPGAPAAWFVLARWEW